MVVGYVQLIYSCGGWKPKMKWRNQFSFWGGPSWLAYNMVDSLMKSILHARRRELVARREAREQRSQPSALTKTLFLWFESEMCLQGLVLKAWLSAGALLRCSKTSR